MLEKVKALIPITDNNKDIVLNHYISKANLSIRSYLNYKTIEWEKAELEFETQIVDLSIYYYKNKDNQGINQMSQGSRSQSMARGIPQDIKDALPLPRVQVV